MTVRVTAAGVPRQRLKFTYDSQSRRIRKVLKEWDAAQQTFVLKRDTRFLYDGWNVIAEFESSTGVPLALKATYAWGLDLSGTETGAGGVGGLLAVFYQGVSYQVCMDANGNVSALYASSGPQKGTVAARFDHDPFGNRITNTGVDAEICPFGFSTKYRDEETGDVYYGYRVYRPELGRWVSRDPIGERGGINLYGMVGNDPIGRSDKNGLFDWMDGDGNVNPIQPRMPDDPALQSGIGDVLAVVAVFDLVKAFGVLGSAVRGIAGRLAGCAAESITVTVSSHGLRHLAAGSEAAVINAIKADLQGISLAVGQNAQRTISVDGTVYTYRAFRVTEGKISVGTVVEGSMKRNIAQ